MDIYGFISFYGENFMLAPLDIYLLRKLKLMCVQYLFYLLYDYMVKNQEECHLQSKRKEGFPWATLGVDNCYEELGNTLHYSHKKNKNVVSC